MKQIFALLLVAVMCLSFVACSSEGSPGTGDNGTPEQNNQAGNETTDHQHSNHPFFQFLYGEWEYEGNCKDNYPFTKLTVNEDGTCIVDDAAGSWTISDSTSLDGRLYINVLVDNHIIGVAEVSVWAGNYSFDVSDVPPSPGDNWKHNTPVVADDNDIVLSTENWRNYFDLITEAVYSENAFGEVESLTLTQYLVLKEEYAQKILATDVAYEIETTASEYCIDVNAAEKTYTLGEIVETRTPSEPQTGWLWRDHETNRYQIRVASGNIEAGDSADPDSTSPKSVWLVAGIESINMVRIQGNIYIINE